MNHRIKATHLGKKSPAIKRDNPVAPNWPNFKGAAQFVGTSPSGRVNVFVDPGIDPQGVQNAQDLLNDADRVMTANDGIFGTAGGNVNVLVFALNGATDGTGGADHMSCDFVNGAAIEVDASFGSSPRCSALFEAELSECSMGGNVCGENTGEALSRWCAMVVGNNVLQDFVTAPTWAADGEPDFITNTDNSDTNPDSTGAGMAFISWLISQGFGLEKIAPVMVNLGDGGTFAQVYGTLTGDDPNNALPNFMNAIQALPNGVTSDDPFNGLANPLQMTHLAPRTAEVVGRVLASMIADIAAGSHPDQIAANVRAALVPASRPVRQELCTPKSKRLLPPGTRPSERSRKTA